MYAVETKNLTKRYGKTYALKNLDFTIDENEIMVLLGPNGSGKTTLLLILATVLKPTSGQAKLMGLDVNAQPTRVRQILGIAFQEARGFWRHKPADILRFHANVCGVPKTKRDTLIENILKDLELWDARNKLFMHLSGGQAKRLEVAKVFVQRPKFAILDEPSSQVDLRGKRKIWAKILELRKEGSTILVATNEVREAEYLADRVTVLDKGAKIVCDNVRQLKDSITGGDIVELEIDTPDTQTLKHALSQIEGTVKITNSDVNQFKAYVSMAESWVPKMTEMCYQNKAHIRSIRVTEPSLDDVFLHFTGRALTEDNR
ncbi:MAG: ABC transporter ATP-binding protein [Candidatus Bathyarchaeota archaeon]|nr:ABC transporter ATP-binding protein [Candidatus Bathyarchaeota archaeon]MDH5495231.1 ABC transporter ATP-binding protein [Candidatus Bathyarchaeota archaeon]